MAQKNTLSIGNGNGRMGTFVITALASVWATVTAFQQHQMTTFEAKLDQVNSSHYMTPGAAERLAEMKQMFVEVETQFHAFKDRMLENEAHTAEGIGRNRDVIDEMLRVQGVNKERLARLEEHLSLVGRSP